MPATAAPHDSLIVLEEVSNLYKAAKQIRKSAARAARRDEHTFQAIADAMGVTRSRAFGIIQEGDVA